MRCGMRLDDHPVAVLCPSAASQHATMESWKHAVRWKIDCRRTGPMSESLKCFLHRFLNGHYRIAKSSEVRHRCLRDQSLIEENEHADLVNEGQRLHGEGSASWQKAIGQGVVRRALKSDFEFRIDDVAHARLQVGADGIELPTDERGLKPGIAPSGFDRPGSPFR